MSTTPGERKALVFLAALLTLGASARFVAALRDQAHAARTPAENTALAAQLAAVDSQRNVQRQSRHRGAPQRQPKARKSPVKAATPGPDTLLIVDVDRASASELEALPRIGPALAKRIVSDREEHGPFGSISGLLRVKGIGPKLVTHISKQVTFSGSVRPTTALSISVGSVSNASRPPPHG